MFKFFPDNENITFALLKSLPHVKYWWDGYYERHEKEDSEIFETEPTWASVVDAFKEEFYHVGNYDDQYTRWMTVRQGRDQTVMEYINIIHTLRSKLGIKDCELHLVLKYRSGLHRYIQSEMDFLDISSLGAAYRYAIKIEQSLRKRISRIWVCKSAAEAGKKCP